MRDGALWPIYSGAMGSVCVLTQYNYCGDHSYCDRWGALGDKDNSNQRLHRACTGGPLHVQTSVVHRTWCHCCFSSPPRLTFGTGVDRCDDSVGHNRGCHLVSLWAFKGGGNRCWYDLSLIQWVVSSPLAIGNVDNLTQHCSCWCSMHMTM